MTRAIPWLGVGWSRQPNEEPKNIQTLGIRWSLPTQLLFQRFQIFDTRESPAKMAITAYP